MGPSFIESLRESSCRIGVWCYLLWFRRFLGLEEADFEMI